MAEIVVVSAFTAKPGKEADAKQAFERLLEPTHKEPGCILYALHQGADDPTRLAFIERWATREELDAHPQSDHIADVLRRVDELFQTSDITVYGPLPGGEIQEGITRRARRLELNGYVFEHVHHEDQRVGVVGVRLLHPEPPDTPAVRAFECDRPAPSQQIVQIGQCLFVSNYPGRSCGLYIDYRGPRAETIRHSSRGHWHRTCLRLRDGGYLAFHASRRGWSPARNDQRTTRLPIRIRR